MAGISLGRNLFSYFAQREFKRASSALADSYQRLSSGLRINDAADDPAGLALATRLNSKSRVFAQAVRNVNDGISAASTANSALTALRDITQRQLELATQAANGTLTLSERQSLNTEANTLVNEFNRIAGSVTFNGRSLLDPSLNSLIIQAGEGNANSIQVTFSNQLKRAIGDGTFATPQSIGDSTFLGTLVGDFNQDGMLDLLTTSGATIYFAQGNGDGTFKAAVSKNTGNVISGAVAYDFDNNGTLDLVSQNGTTISVMLGNGNGSFKARKSFTAVVDDPVGFVAADFDQDGNLDLVSSDVDAVYHVFHGNGDGTFSSLTTLTLPGSNGAPGLVTGDFNGDGNLDFISGGYQKIGIVLGNGDGTFHTPQNISLSTIWAEELHIADFNNDGRLDLVGEDNSSGSVFMMIGNGDGTFASPVTLVDSSNFAYHVNTGDFNGDGYTDIVSVKYNGDYTSAVLVRLGNGDGSFAAAISTPSTLALNYEIMVGDYTGDGRSDLIIQGYDYVTRGNQLYLLSGNGTYSSTAPHLNINTVSDAENAITSITQTLNRVTAQLGTMGATLSRFDVTVENLQASRDNFAAASDRITDVDTAAETANVLSSKIRQQAASAILAQANQQPALVLSLLGSVSSSNSTG